MLHVHYYVLVLSILCSSCSTDHFQIDRLKDAIYVPEMFTYYFLTILKGDMSDLLISYLLNLLIKSSNLSSKRYKIITLYRNILQNTRKKCIQDMYRINCWLPINLGYCLPTIMTPFVIKLVSEVYGRFRRVTFSEEMTEGFWLAGL